MKRIYLILVIALTILFYGKTATAQVGVNQAVEQVLEHADSASSKKAAEPIIKTVVIEEDEAEDDMSPRDKWITGILAAFGFVGVLVFRLLVRKRKKR